MVKAICPYCHSSHGVCKGNYNEDGRNFCGKGHRNAYYALKKYNTVQALLDGIRDGLHHSDELSQCADICISYTRRLLEELEKEEKVSIDKKRNRAYEYRLVEDHE